MKKMPTIFLRDFGGDPSKVTEEPNPEADWVFAGEGVATRKYDGTCCMFDGKKWFKRREVKSGNEAPTDFLEVDHDAITGKSVGWVPVTDADKWHMEGIKNSQEYYSGKADLPIGTYELCGPKIQGNPEQFSKHYMIAHEWAEIDDPARTYNHICGGFKSWFMSGDFIWEGYVFHHPDGRMAKIKVKDFGLTRGPSALPPLPRNGWTE